MHVSFKLFGNRDFNYVRLLFPTKSTLRKWFIIANWPLVKARDSCCNGDTEYLFVPDAPYQRSTLKKYRPVTFVCLCYTVTSILNLWCVISYRTHTHIQYHYSLVHCIQTEMWGPFEPQKCNQPSSLFIIP